MRRYVQIQYSSDTGLEPVFFYATPAKISSTCGWVIPSKKRGCGFKWSLQQCL